MRSAQRPDTRALDVNLFVFCLLALGATVLYPSVRLLGQALANWESSAILGGAGYLAVRNTLLIAFASVITSGALGTGLALILSRYSFPGRDRLAVLAYLPFTLPPLVGVLSFYYLIGRDGLVPRVLERLTGVSGFALAGPVAILLIHTYSFYVFFYAMVSAALDAMDVSQVEAARTLGAARLRVFAKIVVPALTPALLGASLLAFMASVASFSAPYFFGQDYPMLSVQIFNERSQFHHGAALTLTVVLAIVSLLGLAIFRSSRPAPGVAASKGVRKVIHRRGARVLVAALLWVFMLLLLVPHATIAWLAFVDHHAWHTELIPSRFTLGNFAALLRDPQSFTPIRNSLWMSAVAAAAALATALPAAYLVARRRPGSRVVNLLVMIPWALPGTVIAMNLIGAFNDPWLPLYNTVWMLPLSYFVRGLPLLTRMAGAAIEPFDASLIEAGRTLGASPTFCFLHIAVPLLAPALAAATALVFATSLGEFVTSILLYMPQNIPMAVKINMEWRGSVGTAFAYSVFLMLLVGTTFLVSRRFASAQV